MESGEGERGQVRSMVESSLFKNQLCSELYRKSKTFSLSNEELNLAEYRFVCLERGFL